jgi:hypothetical protein
MIGIGEGIAGRWRFMAWLRFDKHMFQVVRRR